MLSCGVSYAFGFLDNFFIVLANLGIEKIFFN